MSVNYRSKKIGYDRKSDKAWFIVLAVMLSLFCVLKVLRGSDTESTSAGGIWNYISLLYYPIFLLLLINHRKYRLKTLFVSSGFYVLLAVITALINSTSQLSVSTAYSFLMIPYALVVFWTFYLCSDESKAGQSIILLGYFVCLCLNLYTVAMYQFAGAARAMPSDIYFSLGLFPFALQLLKNKKLKTIVIVAEFFAVFMVNKRTALISFVIALVVYFLVNSYVNEGSKFFGTIKTIIIVAVAVTLFYYISKYFDDKYNLNIYYRLFRITEDGGSGRDDIYQNVWQGFKDSTFLRQLFGHGMNTAGQVGGAGQAHNDFLEILYDYGIFALISVAVFYVSVIFEAFRLIKRKSPFAAAFAFSVIIGLFLAMFSYFLVFYTYVTCIMAFWGYALALERKRLITEKNR